MVDGGRPGVLDVLCLATVAPCGYHHPPRGAPRQLGAGMLADQMQTQVQARGHSGRCQNGAFINEQNTGVDVDVGVPPRQLAGPLPMGGGSPAVQQPGSGQREGPNAHGCDPGTVVGRGAQRRNCLWVRLFQEPMISRNDHEIRIDQRVHPVRSVNLYQTPVGCRADRRALPTHPYLVFRQSRRGAAGGRGSRLPGCQVGHAEDLAGDHEFETHDLLERQHTDDHHG